ncbi:unnamed protein product [Victoria cruziana]
MIPFNFIHITLFSVTLAFAHGSNEPAPTEYGHTLPDLSQEKILNCTAPSPTERPLCELEAALDAQGRPATTKEPNPSPQPPKPSNNSCKFRQENIYSLYPYSTPPPPELNRVLEKYVAMHRRCRDIDFESLDHVYTSSKRPRCRYLIWSQGRFGFGNRLLPLISSFLYAIMSARVFLIDYPHWDDLFCEPFLGSTTLLPATTKLSRQLGPWYTQFHRARCGSGVQSRNSICNATVVNLVLDIHDHPLSDYESIACPMGYARLRNIPFVTIRKCNQYFAPIFYLNPVLSPLLDVLFPERNPFHLLSRFLLAPNDAMWSSISSHLDIHASRRIGVQIRELKTRRRYISEYDENVLQCIKRKGGFLPKMFRKRILPGEYVAVYMATLVKRHLEEVNSSMAVLMKETGKEFILSFQRLDGREVHDTKHQAEALVDMWVLSMSHVLITSQDSTFGYIASALSGVVPNFLDKRAGKGCLMGLGMEPCFHAAPKKLSCVQQEPVAFSLQEMADRTSKLKVCVDRESGWTVAPRRPSIFPASENQTSI